MIVATAGHIDHGKTSLVRALTGVDTDRLPEEKRRGLSIDIGFAYSRNKSAALGFVDVPGHERFVRNMIAGVTAIDCALLVIAADDGPMPQTREHLAILSLLGVSLGAVALTKIDRVAPERVAEARAEIAELLKGTRFAYAPLFPLSAVTGEGLEPLRLWLDEQATLYRNRRAGGSFRLAIDRAFVIEGAGIVATGAVSSGKADIDDRLILAPDGIEVRLRGVHAQNRKAAQARAGERCAVNIVAPRLSLDQVHRGQWLVSPEIFQPVTRFDARLSLLDSEPRALRHWTPAHVHIGAADVPARIALLEGAPLEPGETALGQIVLQSPIAAFHADRFILRDQSGQRTLGGGAVIDPFAPARGRARPARLERLRALKNADAVAAARKMLDLSPEGFRIGEFCLARNMSANARANLRAALEARILGEGRSAIAVSHVHWQVHVDEVGRFIREAGADGVSASSIAAKARNAMAAETLAAVLTELTERSLVTFNAGRYRPAGAAAQLDPRDEALWTRCRPCLDDLRPPSISELAAESMTDSRAVEGLLRKVARMGLAVQIAPNRYYLPDRLQDLAQCAEQVAAETPLGLVSIRAFRDKSGVGRNLSVEVLEFFDRLGFTARAGEHRRVMKPRNKVRWVRVSGA